MWLDLGLDQSPYDPERDEGEDWLGQWLLDVLLLCSALCKIPYFCVNTASVLLISLVHFAKIFPTCVFYLIIPLHSIQYNVTLIQIFLFSISNHKSLVNNSYILLLLFISQLRYSLHEKTTDFNICIQSISS